jgi:hypothetical protein
LEEYKTIKCPSCNGTGVTEHTFYSEYSGDYLSPGPCERCGGLYTEEWETKGSGKSKSTTRVFVRGRGSIYAKLTHHPCDVCKKFHERTIRSENGPSMHFAMTGELGNRPCHGSGTYVSVVESKQPQPSPSGFMGAIGRWWSGK